MTTRTGTADSRRRTPKAIRALARAKQLVEYLIEDAAGIVADAEHGVRSAIHRRRPGHRRHDGAARRDGGSDN